jgi:hypothetical protein
MSITLLYYAFSICSYKYVRAGHQDGQVILTIHQELKTLLHKAYGSSDVQPQGKVE